jgi:hypothetical protein
MLHADDGLAVRSRRENCSLADTDALPTDMLATRKSIQAVEKQ